MTVENCIERYRQFVQRGDIAGAEGLRKYMLSASKFQGNPILDKFLPPVQEQLKKKKKIRKLLSKKIKKKIKRGVQNHKKQKR